MEIPLRVVTTRQLINYVGNFPMLRVQATTRTISRVASIRARNDGSVAIVWANRNLRTSIVYPDQLDVEAWLILCRLPGPGDLRTADVV